jgi:Family of unknown function (DUF6263)
VRILRTLAVLCLVGSAFAAPFVPTSTPPLAGEDVQLAWKFKAGDVLRYRIVQDTRQTISSGQGEFEVGSNVSQVIGEKVKSVSADGVASIDCTWEAVKLHIGLPMGGDMDFDSTQAGSAQSAPPLLKGFASLPGSTFQIEMKPNGEIASLHGIGDAMKKVLTSDDAVMKGMKDMMERAFNDDSMKRALEAAVLPDKPVAPGGTWARDTEFDMQRFAKMKAHFDLTYAGTENQSGSPCAKVNVKHKITMGAGKPDTSSMPGGENFDIDLSMDDASGDGSFYFSADKGRLILSTMTTDMDMNMTLKPKGQDKGDEGKMEMAVRVNLKSTVSLLGADDPAFEASPKKDSAAKDAASKDPKAKKGKD